MKRLLVKLLPMAGLLACTLASAQSASTLGFQFTQLPSFSSTDGYAYRAYATGLNNLGQVVGWSTMATSNGSAVLWSNNAIIDLGTFSGGDASRAAAINDHGVIVGNAVTASGETHAALFSPTAAAQDLGTLGGPRSMANGVNNLGVIVGTSYTADTLFDGELYYEHAATWNSSGITDQGSAGNFSSGSAINDSGLIVGNVSQGFYAAPVVSWNSNGSGSGSPVELSPNQLPGTYVSAVNGAGVAVGRASVYSEDGSSLIGVRPVVWSGGTMTELNTQGGFNAARDINDAGWIVGQVNNRATLWTSTDEIDLNSFLAGTQMGFDWELTEATGINDNGWIVVNARNRFTYQEIPFLLSPVAVPETGTWAMFALGFAGLAMVARRRRAH